MTAYKVCHVTTYQYASQVSSSRHVAHLAPRILPWQNVENIIIHCAPSPSFLEFFDDYYGNRIDCFEVTAPHETLKVTVESQVTVSARTEPDIGSPIAQTPWEQWQQHLQTELTEQHQTARDFLNPSPLIPHDPHIRQFAETFFTANRPVLEAVMLLNRHLFEDFTYKPGVTDITTAVTTVIERMEGVCQDFAQVFIAAVRAMGLPARYVSGYLETQPPPGQVKLQGVDASHAWVSVYLPFYGWVDFDPTNGCLAGDRHLTVAWGRDFSDVSPLRGVVSGGGQHNVSVGVDVARLLSRKNGNVKN